MVKVLYCVQGFERGSGMARPFLILLLLWAVTNSAIGQEAEQTSPTPDAPPAWNRQSGGSTESVAKPTGVDVMGTSIPQQENNNVSPVFSTDPGAFGLDPGQDAGVMSPEDSSLRPDNPASDEMEAPGDAVPQVSSGDQKTHRWRIKPVFGVGWAYDSNVTLAHTNPVATGVLGISGGASVQVGDYREHRNSFLEFNYLGIGYFFGSDAVQNFYNQYARFLGQYTVERLRIQYASDFAYADMPNRFSGAFLTSINYYNALRFLYIVSQKTDLDCEFSQRSTINVDQLNNYFNQVLLGGDYAITHKLRLGGEAIVGSNPAEDSPTRYYQILNGRLRYDLTGKMIVKATGGVQYSQYASGGAPSKLTPVFSIGGEYLLFSDAKAGSLADLHQTDYRIFNPNKGDILFSGSSIAINLYRNQQPSPNLKSQDYIATGGEIGLNKTIGSHWSANVSVGYENDTYLANQSTVSTSRVDNFVFIRPGITYRFMKRLQLDLFYERSMNTSSYENYAFNDNRIGMELKTSF